MTKTHTSVRGRALRIAIALTAGLLAAPGAGPALAAPVHASATPVAGWSTNGPVYATAIIGDTVYAGGSFTQVRNQGGSQVLARTNLAAFDRVTGAIRSTFTANTNGIVRSLATDGTRLYAGGSFTTIGGAGRQRLAALDPATGAVNTGWVVNANTHVYALSIRSTRLYVGGAFTTLGGAARSRLAVVSTTTGAIDPTFLPNPNASVRAVVASPDGTTVYAGGQFSAIGGGTRSWLAPVSATNGAITNLVFDHPPADQVLALDIAPSGTQLFTGSMANRAASYSTANGVRQWVQQADGDIQAIRYRDGSVFFGFHDGFANNTTAHLLAADATTGALEPWQPTINSFWGVWAIAATDNAMAIGGEFTVFSGVQTQGVAVLPNTATDTVAPTPPTGLSVTATTGSTVALGWTAGTDNVAVGAYRVLRDDVEIAYTTATTITDTGLASGVNYGYVVQTVDTSGNRSASAAVNAGTNLSLITPGSVWQYSDQGLDLGTGWSAAAYDDSAWASGPGQLGYGDGDEATVIGFGPDAANKYTTTYFRRHVNVANPAAIGPMTLRLLRDDGAIAYLNGTEIARSNMPAGAVTRLTRASSTASSPDESTYFSFAVNPALLVAGDNVLAVEVHQINLPSNDMSFDAALDTAPAAAAPVVSITSPSDGSAIATPTTSFAGQCTTAAGTVTVNVTGSASASLSAPCVAAGWSVAGALAEGAYSATASQTDATPVTGTSSASNFVVDLTAPGAPTGLVSSSVTTTDVTISWSAATDNSGIAGYRVVRSGTVLPGTVTGLSFTDTGLTAATAYTYAVRAVDRAGNVGADSAPLPVTTASLGLALFSESWAGANASAWPAAWTSNVANATVDIQGGEGRLTFNDVASAYARARLTGLANQSNSEVTFSYRWAGTGPTGYFSINLRGSGGWTNAYRPLNGYGVEFSSNSTTASVLRVANGATTNLATVTGAQSVSTARQWVRIRVSGSTIQLRTWADGSPEPATWRSTVVDSTVTAAGQLYLSLARGSTNVGAKTVLIDNLNVLDAT